MKRSFAVAVALAAGVAAVSLSPLRGAKAAAVAQDPADSFVAALRGSAEVPPVMTDTQGRFAIDFNETFTRARFELFVNDGERITQAHFHCAPRGVNGPIFIFLAGFHERGWDLTGEWIGGAVITNDNIIEPSCGTTLRQVARSMQNGQVYVNVHSIANPGGEVRGQVRVAPAP